MFKPLVAHRRASTGVISVKDLDKNFKPINILVFRNGDPFDSGTEISITRRQFPNWLTLLDFLTEKLNLTDGAVHTLHTVSGREVRTFQELENARWYVGAHGRFRDAPYGAKVPKQWKSTANAGTKDPKGISSSESLEMYLRTRGYKPFVGDVWDDSQFDLMKKNALFSSPLMHRRHFAHRSAEIRSRSADGLSNKRGTLRPRRSRTEDALHRNRHESRRVVRYAISLPSSSVRLPNPSKTQSVVNARQPGLYRSTLNPRLMVQHRSHGLSRYHSDHGGSIGSRQATTVLSSSRVESTRRGQSEANQRAMQWDARPAIRNGIGGSAPASILVPRKAPMKLDAEANSYKPADPRVTRQQEDRAYQFYERQRQLDLKKELVDKATKRPPWGHVLHDESDAIFNSRTFAGENAVKNSVYDTFARQPLPARNAQNHKKSLLSSKPSPYRLPPAQKGNGFNVKGQTPLLKYPTNQKFPGKGIKIEFEKSPRWVTELTSAVEKLAREVSTLSKKNHPRIRRNSKLRFYDSD